MTAITQQWERVPPRARPAALWLAVALGYLLMRLTATHAVATDGVELLWPGLGLVFLAGLERGLLLAVAPAAVAFG